MTLDEISSYTNLDSFLVAWLKSHVDSRRVDITSFSGTKQQLKQEIQSNQSMTNTKVLYYGNPQEFRFYNEEGVLVRTRAWQTSVFNYLFSDVYIQSNLKTQLNVLRITMK